MGNCFNKSRRQVQSSTKEKAPPRTGPVKQKSSRLFNRKRRSTRVAPKSDDCTATDRRATPVPTSSLDDDSDTQDSVDLVSKSSMLSAFYGHCDSDEIKPGEDKSTPNIFAARRDSPYHSSNERIYEEFTEVGENIEEVIDEAEDDVEALLPNAVPANEKNKKAETTTNPGAGKVSLDMEEVEKAIKRLYGLKKEFKRLNKKIDNEEEVDDVSDILPDNSTKIDRPENGSRGTQSGIDESNKSADEVNNRVATGNCTTEDNGSKIMDSSTPLSGASVDEELTREEENNVVATKHENNIKSNVVVKECDERLHLTVECNNVPATRTKLIRVKVVDVKHEDVCQLDRSEIIHQKENDTKAENSEENCKSHAVDKITTSDQAKREELPITSPGGMDHTASKTCDTHTHEGNYDYEKGSVCGKPLKGFTKSESDVDKLKADNKDDDRNCKSAAEMPTNKDYKQDVVKSLAKRISQESIDKITNHNSRSDCEFSLFVRSPTSDTMPRMVKVKASNKQIQDGSAKTFIKQKENINSPVQYFNELHESKKYQKRNQHFASNLIDSDCQVQWREKQGPSTDVVLTQVPEFYKPPPKTKNALETLGIQKLQKYGIIPQCKEIERIKINEDQFPGILPPKIRQKWVQKKNEKKYVN
ncbi:hypothetical protein ACF0H5_009861 [Mactra antiquata]